MADALAENYIRLLRVAETKLNYVIMCKLRYAPTMKSKYQIASHEAVLIEDIDNSILKLPLDHFIQEQNSFFGCGRVSITTVFFCPEIKQAYTPTQFFNPPTTSEYPLMNNKSALKLAAKIIIKDINEGKSKQRWREYKQAYKTGKVNR
mmetsp:Transcript_24955/g.42212  ORF Transcript_24955/g.42212 Transcript_24955/m.42212 type:complete len:149 (+) Transcript_24955:570-1016(+)